MKQMRVLILEGNEGFARELEEAFAERESCEVVGRTGDGAEGIELIRNVHPDAVVMSLFLKNLDGFTVMEETKGEEKRPKFVVMGNYADDKIINRAIALGARYYLMKPISAEVVRERVTELRTEKDGTTAEGVERRRGGNLDERISNIFISIGIPPHIKGYQYLREGIKMAVEDPHIINNVTKGLYPIIDGEQGRASDSACDRSGMEPRSDRGGERNIRRAGLLGDGEADEQRIHCTRCRQTHPRKHDLIILSLCGRGPRRRAKHKFRPLFA